MDLAALHDGWSREETATNFTLALEGPALQVLIDLSSKERCDLQALTAALNRRFGQRTSAEQRREELTDRRWREGENVGTFAADIRVYAGKGYPSFPAATREELEELSCRILHLSDSASMSACCHPEIWVRHWERLWELRRCYRLGWRQVDLRSSASWREQPNERRTGSSLRRRSAGPTSGDPPMGVQIRPLISLQRIGALCQGLPCSEPPAPDSVTAGKWLRNEAVRGPSPRSLSPLHQDCPIVGCCGLARGLYLDCVARVQPWSALVDTGSTICLLRKGLLSGTAGPLPEDWTPTNTELLTVTGERTVMPGKKLLSVVVGMSQTRHEFWLADIRDEYIVGLDLLAHWGARVDVPGAALCLCNETVPFRSGRSRHEEATTPLPSPRHQCSPAPAPSHRTRAAETQGEPWRNIVAQTSTPQPLTPHTPSVSPSPETVVAVEELGRQSGEHLSTPQQSSCDIYWETLWTFLQHERRTVPGQLWCSITLTQALLPPFASAPIDCLLPSGRLPKNWSEIWQLTALLRPQSVPGPHPWSWCGRKRGVAPCGLSTTKCSRA